jgi:hypothetical protein
MLTAELETLSNRIKYNATTADEHSAQADPVGEPGRDTYDTRMGIRSVTAHPPPLHQLRGGCDFSD